MLYTAHSNRLDDGPHLCFTLYYILEKLEQQSEATVQVLQTTGVPSINVPSVHVPLVLVLLLHVPMAHVPSVHVPLV